MQFPPFSFRSVGCISHVAVYVLHIALILTIRVYLFHNMSTDPVPAKRRRLDDDVSDTASVSASFSEIDSPATSVTPLEEPDASAASTNSQTSAQSETDGADAVGCDANSDNSESPLPPSAEPAKWVPKSISSISDMYLFDSSTYHSPIPSEILRDMTAPVVLGVDEAGRGPVMGPMVYGISYCLKEYQEHLKKKYGFADSKTLKDLTRQDLFKLIDEETHELCANVGWATCTMTAKDISNGMLRSALGAGSYNLNEQAHDTTIQLIKDTVASGVNVQEVFVDTVGPPATYQAKLLKIFPGIDITVTKKADSIYPIVSTASVVAKVTRDLNLQWYNEHHETLKGHKIGSGYPSDPNTSKWLTGNVDKVFGWSHGLIRFLWQTAKDALEKHGGVRVIYEAECVKNSGYGDVSDMFGAKSSFAIDALYYGRDVQL